MDRFNCGFVEVKFAPSEEGHAESMAFSGYGAAFGNIDSYGDLIVKGAFDATLTQAKASGQWPAMLLQHGGWAMGAEDMTPIGIWTEMKEDDHGLYVEGLLADTARGREAYTLLKMTHNGVPRPAFTGLSIGYWPKEFERGKGGDEPRRTLKKVDLFEVSLVTIPANDKARVGQVKSDITIREIERALREAGLSRAQAKALLADGYKALSLRDAEESGVEELAALVRRNIANLTA